MHAAGIAAGHDVARELSGRREQASKQHDGLEGRTIRLSPDGAPLDDEAARNQRHRLSGARAGISL